MESSEIERFETVVLPHLDAAYTLARYLMRDAHDAEDVVQDACLRAMRHIDQFRGGEAARARAWFLTIVRNAAWSARRRRGAERQTTEFDEMVHSGGVVDGQPDPLERAATRESLELALDQLSDDLREIIVLREVEGLSYKEISDVAGIPIGTVMSRLSRARARLQDAWRAEQER